METSNRKNQILKLSLVCIAVLALFCSFGISQVSAATVTGTATLTAANAPLYMPPSHPEANFQCVDYSTPYTYSNGNFPVLVSTAPNFSAGDKLVVPTASGQLCNRVAQPGMGWCKTCGCRNVPGSCEDIQNPGPNGLVNPNDPNILIGFYSSNAASVYNTPIAEYSLVSFAGAGITIPAGTNYIYAYYKDAPGEYYDNNIAYTLTFGYQVVPAAPACTSHASQKCVGNAVYWFDSCGTQQDLAQTCSGSQTCSNAQCVSNCTQNVTKACVGNAVYNFDSCGAQGSLFQTCTANQTCSNAQCINQNITCSSNTDCGQSGYTGSPFCQGNNVYQPYVTYTCNNPGTVNSTCTNSGTNQLKQTCAGNQTCSNGTCSNSCTPNTVKQCVGNTVYNYDSCGTQGSLFQTCTANQTCSNGTCVNQHIACTASADCGTNAYTGSPVCQNGNVYQNFVTYTCANPGTSGSTCSNSTSLQLKTTCGANQTCSNGACTTPVQNITCSASADCGANKLSGNPFCQGNDVYTNQLTYYCNNPGTTQSYCSNSLVPQLTSACGTNKTCSNGSCASQNISCGSNADCGFNGLSGNAFCQGEKSFKNYLTYTCNNPGTSQSYCSSSLTPQLIQTCSPTQRCTNGTCSLYNAPVCSTSSDCGASGLTGSPFCQGSNVYQNNITYTCQNPGTLTATCVSATNAQLVTTCAGNQTCAGGTCSGSSNSCTSHAYQQCQGNYLSWFDSCGVQQETQFCQNGCSGNTCQGGNNGSVTVQTNPATNVTINQATLNGYVYGTNYGNYGYGTNVWFQWGPTASYGQETLHQTMNSTAPFSQIVNLYSAGNATFHFRGVGQTGNGALVYGQDMTFNTNGSGYVNGNLTVSKAVRNLSNGSGFANSTSAMPGDMLMFMITLQANGSDVQNVVVRDSLPANLVYNNQLVVACTTNGSYNNNCNGNNYSNYTGNIGSGVYLNTIYSGQTVTITYQVQVASAPNFAFGTTTLSNSVYVTSSNGSNPSASATVFINRTAVYGASSVSTGLTNNFWTDSFFLPLLITLILIWMWQAGMFIGIEKWLSSKTKVRRTFKAEKELNSRIAEIRGVRNF